MRKISIAHLLIAICMSSQCGNAYGRPGPEPESPSFVSTTLLTPDIGGIKQVIEVKSDNLDKPVLLILSGGPGSSMMNNAERFTASLRKIFTIVQWDQRNAGKTLALNASPVAPTLELMQNDTLQVIEFVRKTYRKEKIYLLGSSWGNVLGFHAVRHQPGILHAYFAVNPVVSQRASEQALLTTLKRHFHDNVEASRELASVHIPFTRDEDLFYLRKWLFFKEGKAFATTQDFKEHFLQWSTQWSPVWQEVMQIDWPTSLPKVEVPIYFFVGEQDLQTLTSITQDYYLKLEAPKKQLLVFERSGHQIHQDAPERLQNEIIRLIDGGQSGVSTR